MNRAATHSHTISERADWFVLLAVALLFMTGCIPPDPANPVIEQEIWKIIEDVNPDAPTTVDSVAALRSMGPDATPLLLQILTARNEEGTSPRFDRVSRWAATYALNGLVGDASLTPLALQPALEDEDPTIAVLAAATTLGCASIEDPSLQTQTQVDRAREILLRATTLPDVMFLSEPPEKLSDFAEQVLEWTNSDGDSAISAPLPLPPTGEADRRLGSSALEPKRSQATDHDCRISIVVPIEFRGDGATPSRVDRWVDQIESFWNGADGVRTYRNLVIEFMIDAIIRSGKERKNGYHQIYVEKAPPWGYTRSSVSFNLTCLGPSPDDRRTFVIKAFECSAVESEDQKWRSNATSLILAHEFGHLVGLGDEYTGDSTNINPQVSNPQSIMGQVYGEVDVLPEHLGFIVARALEGGARLPCTQTILVASEHQLYAIAPTANGVDRLVGTIRTQEGETPSITDLAWDQASSQLWGVSFDRLYRIDGATGEAEIVGTGLGVDNVNALACDTAGHLYAANRDGGLFEIDTGKGHAIAIGGGEGMYHISGDLAFLQDGRLVATATAGDLEDTLVLVDLQTGTATPVGKTGFSGVFGLFVIDDSLYGVTVNSELLSINTGSGKAALLRRIDFGGWGAESKTGDRRVYEDE
jgi:hypothetical protein